MSTVSIEAEQSVLGAILLDRYALDRVRDIIGPEDFYRADHRDAMSAAIKLSSEGKDVDHISVADEISKSGRDPDLGYLVELSANTPSAANVGTYARILRDRSQKRALVAALEEAGRAVSEEGTASAEDLTARAASLIGGLQCTDGTGVRNPKEIIKSLSQMWMERSEANGEIRGIKTGIGDLDQRFLGWKAGDLIVMAGRPAMGKSALGFQILQYNAVREGKRVMAFSVEMPSEQVMQRMTANQSGVDLDVFRRCDKEDFAAHSREITSAAQLLGNTDMLIDDTPGIHINQVMVRARAAHRKSPIHLLLIDHIHIVRSDGQSREREIANITGSLKQLAKEIGCPILALAQLNRGVEQRQDKRPSMADLRDSGSIEQDADIVALLYRDDYYKADSRDKGILEVIIGKYREGETGTDYCKHELRKSRIMQLDYEYQPPPQEKSSPRKGFD